MNHAHRQAAEGRAARLQAAIGQYDSGRLDSALAQFLALAEGDCEEASLYLSLIFRDDDYSGKDEPTAVRHKTRYVQLVASKAAAGLPGYQLKLAYILQFGDGIAIDDAAAFALFVVLAEQGCGEARFHLSRIYAHGQCGQAPNAALEAEWLGEAVKSEWPKALYYAALYLDRPGAAAASLRQITALMTRSAELGCWQAQEYLAENP